MGIVQILGDAMFGPERRYLASRLEPAKFAALRITVDAGVSFGKDDLRLAISVYIPDCNKRRDIVGGILMLTPLPIVKLIPVRPRNDLYFAVAIYIGESEALFRLV